MTMKFTLKEGHYLLEAENDRDRKTLDAFIERTDEVRVENRAHLFRDYEIVIYIPTIQPIMHSVSGRRT